jgi:phosphohistidine phosphatase SixA
MSRELLILRHAHAEPQAPGGTDFERPLSAKGRDEAAAVRAWLSRQKLTPARVLASPAARAKATAEIAFADAKLTLVARIYEAMPGDLVAVLDEHVGDGLNVMVGHNPGLEQFVALLAEGRSEDFRGLPTAGVAHLQLPAAGTIEPGSARIQTFWWP